MDVEIREKLQKKGRANPASRSLSERIRLRRKILVPYRPEFGILGRHQGFKDEGNTATDE